MGLGIQSVGVSRLITLKNAGMMEVTALLDDCKVTDPSVIGDGGCDSVMPYTSYVDRGKETRYRDDK